MFTYKKTPYKILTFNPKFCWQALYLTNPHHTVLSQSSLQLLCVRHVYISRCRLPDFFFAKKEKEKSQGRLSYLGLL